MQAHRRAAMAATVPSLLLALLLAILPAGLPGSAQFALARSATPLPAAAPVDLAGVQPGPVDPALLAALDAYARDAAERYGIVGASWAIASGGGVAGGGAYGLREAGGTEPVTPDTRFMIGSVTKSMTSFMAATVVDDGLASWDTPLADLIPGFALADPALAARVSLGDSFCACTGLPRDDFPLIISPLATPAGLLAQLATIQPVASFGEAFNYSNQLYAAGGYAATLAAGGTIPSLARDYDLAMQARVLGPIGMTSSAFRLEDVLASRDYASPHGTNLLGETLPISLLAEDHFVTSVAPAGALWSTAPDMARYLATQLNDGIAPGGARVVSAENLAVTHGQRIAIDPGLSAALPAPLPSAFGGYALGWVVGTWNGLSLLSHSGGTLGFNSEVAMLPEAGAGIVILANGGLNAGLFNLAVQYRFFELLYGLDPLAAPGIDASVALSGQAAADLAAALAAEPAPDAAALAPFAGTYQHPDLGAVRIALEDGVPVLHLANLRSRLGTAPAAIFPAPDATPVAGAEEQRFLLLDPPLGSPALTVSLVAAPAGNELRIDAFDERPHTYVFTALP